MELRAGHVFAGFIAHDGIAEHEVVLRGDRDAVECGIRCIEAGVEDQDPDAGRIDAAIGKWPEMQLTIRHLGRAEDRIVARRHTARVARRGGRQDDGWRQLDGRERASWHWCAKSKPAERLYAAQVAILCEHAQRRRWGIRADGVEPATLYADARAECARSVTQRLEGYARSREQPHGDGCVLCALPDAREHRRY